MITLLPTPPVVIPSQDALWDYLTAGEIPAAGTIPAAPAHVLELWDAGDELLPGGCGCR